LDGWDEEAASSQSNSSSRGRAAGRRLLILDWMHVNVLS
jgi:hypothetical protein